ncbi:carbonic anhydrase [Lysinibacter sp. HNR]|uniref:carbonic anhydrase n=1 Tax=Lysinibacter sp. HNR TaxID=3031408 RepID=UPI0024358C75|nr:carbonic anhydrase [Lysinibacter sp. HNR]WGD38602.1 carbonic anhydrase [Lysinibacter sp. HNR]
MKRGNNRFVAGVPEHPHQDVEHRARTHYSQSPSTALLGCSDSRLAAEIIFDKGLGDLFVVRNAGHIVSDSVVGSLEYAVEMLKISLIVVLAHDECGAVAAAVSSQQKNPSLLPPKIAGQIRPIVPAVQAVWLRDNPSTPYVDPQKIDTFDVGRFHLRGCVAELLRESELISEAVAEGRLGIVGANYRLVEGRADASVAIGPINTDT